MLISALFWSGVERDALIHVIKNHDMILSDYIIDELIDFCNKTMPKMSRRAIREIRQAFESLCTDDVDIEIAGTIRDVNDEPVIKLALRNQAIVLSSDKDLLEYPHAKPLVISTAEYTELFMNQL